MPFDGFSTPVRRTVTNGSWSLRPLAPRDHAALLRLNAANTPEVAPITAAELAHLLRFEGRHLVAVDGQDAVLAYLLSFPSSSAYDDEEMRHFRHLVSEPFHYVAQVAVDAAHRGRGIGRRFHATVARLARRRGVRMICTDVNLDPPNHASLAFHHRLGFAPVGQATLSSGWTVAFLRRSH
ncbi:MAG TPA: GNAT family N-acetyltransferase [Lacunisphaera sp.]|jgi:predicted GNAT superfamily acetyltransferase|nr:GNAT family N-acetyltransferase [Lacunisphaera sp.]